MFRFNNIIFIYLSNHSFTTKSFQPKVEKEARGPSFLDTFGLSFKDFVMYLLSPGSLGIVAVGTICNIQLLYFEAIPPGEDNPQINNNIVSNCLNLII